MATCGIPSTAIFKADGGGNRWDRGYGQSLNFAADGEDAIAMANASPNNWMFGLKSKESADGNYTTIDFAIHSTGGTSYKVYELGVDKGVVLAQAPTYDDIVEVRRDGTTGAITLDFMAFQALQSSLLAIYKKNRL